MPQRNTGTQTPGVCRSSIFAGSGACHPTRVAGVLQPLQSPPRCQARRERPKFAPTSTAPSVSGGPMLHYAVVFFVIAIIAAILGFGGLAAGAAGIAKILFIVFLIGAIITFLVGRSRV